MTLDIWIIVESCAAFIVLLVWVGYTLNRVNKLNRRIDIILDGLRVWDETIGRISKTMDDLVTFNDDTKKYMDKLSTSTYDQLYALQKRVEELEYDRKYQQTKVLNVCESLATAVDILKGCCKPQEAVEEASDPSDESDFTTADLEVKQPDKGPVYTWVFPSEEPDHEDRLIFGQWYTVIGTIHGHNKPDGTPSIVTGDGMWNRYQFISMKNERFDDVYAYIKMPNSGDIMEHIVDIALKKKGE